MDVAVRPHLPVLSERDRKRRFGEFFTNQAMADRLLRHWRDLPPNGAKYHDPACGAGSLLLSALRQAVMVRKRVVNTGPISIALSGRDIQPAIAGIGRAALAAACSSENVSGLDVRVDVGDGCGLTTLAEDLDGATHIVLNPPFGYGPPPKENWNLTGGRTNQAAVFLVRCLDAAPKGAKVAAILPDVLRCGTRYARWRQRVSELLMRTSVESVGRFTSEVDVDVFLLFGEAAAWPRPRRTPIRWQPRAARESARPIRVRDAFEIAVGPVVDYRSAHRGPWLPYLTASGAKVWSEIATVDARRRFCGKTEERPFVAIRRTSAPADKWRAACTIVRPESRVAVENHLIVARPKRGGLAACRSLMNALRSERANAWFNKRIRCRHLTIGVIGDFPWKASNG